MSRVSDSPAAAAQRLRGEEARIAAHVPLLHVRGTPRAWLYAVSYTHLDVYKRQLLTLPFFAAQVRYVLYPQLESEGFAAPAYAGNAYEAKSIDHETAEPVLQMDAAQDAAPQDAMLGAPPPPPPPSPLESAEISSGALGGAADKLREYQGKARARQTRNNMVPVSYTHLDVYKRQCRR